MRSEAVELLIDGVRYKACIKRTGEIYFSRICSFAENFETFIYEDTSFGHHTKNPVRVIRQVVRTFDQLIGKTKPDYFWFEVDEQGKDRIYRRFVRHFLATHPEYNYAVDGVRHYFYKYLS